MPGCTGFLKVLSFDVEKATSFEVNLWFFIALSLILIAGLGLIWFNRYAGSRSKQRENWAKTLGFKPVEQADPALLDGISQLYPPGMQVNFNNIYEQRRSDVVFYLADFLLDENGDETANLGEDVIVLTSPYLSLPNFVLIPRIDIKGHIGDLVNRAISELINSVSQKRGLHRVDFDQYSQINDQYIVLGDDPVRLYNFFTASHMQGFYKINPQYEVLAGGNVMILKVIFPDPKKAREQVLRDQFQDAEAIFRFFSQ